MTTPPTTFDSTALPWRRVLVYGLGVSGRAAARLLRRRGVAVVGFDERELPADARSELESLAVELRFGTPYELPADVEAVVISPGVPGDRPLLEEARRRQIEILGEVELAWRCLPPDFGRLVAITGSNGKSTTTALTGELLRRAGHAVAVCGNIGEPMSDHVDGPPGRIFVVELSSFQLETIDHLRPEVAVLLNVSPDHLDRYPSFEAYRQAKLRIFSRQREDEIAVVNADDPATLCEVRARRRMFSLRERVDDGCWLDGDRVLEVEPERRPDTLFRLESLRLAGRHNVENAMAASLVARALGIGPATIATAIEGFEGLPHRMERVAEHAGVVWYDDSKGTNVGATIRSLEDLPAGRVHLILGGRSKGTDLAALRPFVEGKVKCLYLIGEAGEALAEALASAAPQRQSRTLERAVAEAAGAVEPGDVVLLSPACASFDQFRDFAHRGEVFRALVHDALEERQGGRVG